MLLSYETSSISYDVIDLIHGKFIPTKRTNFYTDCSVKDCVAYRPSKPSVRVFINIYGVFANLTGRFAKKYDDLHLPCVEDCIIDYEYIRNHIPKEGVAAIMEEEGFWKHINSYPWHMLLMGEIYKMCQGEYYFLLPLYDSLQLEDRLIWVWRHFGNVAKDRTMLLTCPSAQLLIKSRNDLFIGSNLKNCEDWSLAGGSAYWWPEIDANCKDPARFLSKRIRLMNQAVAGLHELSKK